MKLNVVPLLFAWHTWAHGGPSNGGPDYSARVENGFAIVTSGTCQSNGYEVINDADLCDRATVALGVKNNPAFEYEYPTYAKGCGTDDRRVNHLNTHAVGGSCGELHFCVCVLPGTDTGSESEDDSPEIEMPDGFSMLESGTCESHGLDTITDVDLCTAAVKE